MAEGTRPHEAFNTAGYTEIPQLNDVDAVMHEFADYAAKDIVANPHADIVVPLNGSIIPLYYLIDRVAQDNPEALTHLIDQVLFVQDISDDKGMIAFVFDTERRLSQQAMLVDDIGDKLQVLAALSDIYPDLTVHTPVKKQHTDTYQQNLPVVTVVNATVETANEWIACGCGMNEGAKEGSVEQQAYLSTLQRFSRKGYFKELGNSMSVEEKIAFFEGQLLDDFDRHDDLFMLCQVMEQAKIEKRYDNLMNLAPLVVPAIVDHIKRQNNLAQAQDPHYHEFTA